MLQPDLGIPLDDKDKEGDVEEWFLVPIYSATECFSVLIQSALS